MARKGETCVYAEGDFMIWTRAQTDAIFALWFLSFQCFQRGLAECTPGAQLSAKKKPTLFSKLHHVWVHECVRPFTHTFGVIPGVFSFFHVILSDFPLPTPWTEALKNHSVILRKVQFYCLLFHSCVTASPYWALLYDFSGSNGNKNWELRAKARVWEWEVFLRKSELSLCGKILNISSAQGPTGSAYSLLIQDSSQHCCLSLNLLF